MKICSKCKLSLLESEFSFRTDTGNLNTMCKACIKLRKKEYYKCCYRDQAITNATRHKQKRRQLIREELNKLKDVPCKDCGRKFPPCAMDFDHYLDDKIKDINYWQTSGQKNKALEEAKKCEVVCAVCHRIRTFKRHEYSKR